MSKYGKVIDLGFNPIHLEFKKNIANYFNNPLMTKIKDDFNGCSVYAVEVKTMLFKDKRYLIINCPLDREELGKKIRLSEMDIKVLQTKEMSGIGNPVNRCKYDVRENSRLSEFQQRIEMTNRTKEYTEYNCNSYGIKVTLIHQDKYLYEFPDVATLFTAIEKYSTIIFIK